MHNSSMDYHRSRPANTRMPLKKHLKRTQAQLHELEHRLRPLSTELETLEQGVQKAKRCSTGPWPSRTPRRRLTRLGTRHERCS